MADFRQILTDIRAGKFAPVYILYGQEPYYIDKLVEQLEQSVVAEEDREFDLSVLYGADTTGPQVIEAASRFPMMSPRQLVILKESQSMQRAKDNLDKIAPYLAHKNPSTVLVITHVEKDRDKQLSGELLKAAKKDKDVVVFNSPAVKDKDVFGIVKDYCTAEKIPIEDKAIGLLSMNVGTSLTNIFSEIGKLRVALKGDQKKITADLVNDHIGVSREFNNFELTKALVNRDYYQSINIITHFRDNPKANPTEITAATVFSTFQRLIIAAFNANKSNAALMQALELKTPYQLNDIRTGLAKYNASQLVKAMHAIRDFDVRSKGIGSTQDKYDLLLELATSILLS